MQNSEDMILWIDKRLYKSTVNCMLCGVCGGIAEYFNVDPNTGAPCLGDPHLLRRRRNLGLHHRRDHHSQGSKLKNVAPSERSKPSCAHERHSGSKTQLVFSQQPGKIASVLNKNSLLRPYFLYNHSHQKEYGLMNKDKEIEAYKSGKLTSRRADKIRDRPGTWHSG